MTDQSPKGNSFRAALLRGERPKLLLDEKHPSMEGTGDGLDGVLVPRSEARRANHRDGDRHRLTDERAIVRYRGARHEVDLINLSDGGAMLRANFVPRLWDLLELELGEGMPLEAAVRWVKKDKMGLEFAHETRIGCDSGSHAALLLQVIERSFPGSAAERDQGPAKLPVRSANDLNLRAEGRHPLIWKGEIHTLDGSKTVRLRNISSGGALIEGPTTPPAGTDLLLDLGKAGSLNATVEWAVGDQAGLRFHAPFDVAQLANARPEVVPSRWQQPAYLKDNHAAGSPWADGWNRMSVSDLEDYLKR